MGDAPLKERLMLQKRDGELSDIIKAAQKVTEPSARPTETLILQILDDGQIAARNLSTADTAYCNALPEPAKDADVDLYTSRLTQCQDTFTNWRIASIELSTSLDQIRSSTGQGARGSNTNHPPTSHVNTKKPDRPEIDLESSESQWLFFADEWRVYKKQANLSASDDIVPELRSCCTIELRRSLFDLLGSNTLKNLDEAALLSQIKAVAVRGKTIPVHRNEFHTMVQAQGQRLQDFVSKLKAKAEHCRFSVTCPGDSCHSEVSYSTEMVTDQMVLGCYDKDIQMEILAKSATLDTFEKKYDTMVALEMGKQAKTELSSGDSTTIAAQRTAYQRQKAQGQGQGSDTRSQNNYRYDKQDSSKPNASKCQGCGGQLHGRNYKDHATNRKQKCPARGHACEFCGKTGHFKAVCRTAPTEGTSTHADVEMAVQSHSFACESAATQSPSDTMDQGKTPVIPHLQWNEHGFQPSSPPPSPKLVVQVDVMDKCHQEFGRKLPRIRRGRCRPVQVTAYTDTCAQTCTAGPEYLDILNVPRGYLIPTTHASVSIDQSSLTIFGCVLISITAGSHTTRHPLYITSGCKGFYLSHQAQKDLGIIDDHYPQPKSVENSANSVDSTPATDPKDVVLAPCGCPKRRKPPLKPAHIPFPPTEENRERLEKWLLDQYATSAFNVCEHQPLPQMSGRPLEIHFKEGAVPKACHSPIPVPHHWKGHTKKDLDRDVCIGTLEPVPQGTPTEWCSRMVTVSKKNGDPRRAVDLQAINAATKRETHHTPSPYNQASVVPPKKKKTVMDAWNGYHSLSLAPSARDATTFITEWGRYRYLRAPQGFHAAGDGYTRRYDDITVDIPRKTKCVDDTLLWDDNIEDAFWHVIDYIDLSNANGVVFNPTKFKFAADEVEFAGFEVTEVGLKPTRQMLSAIMDFPTPTNISGVRSWFGLLNQVAYATAISKALEPFRELLKPSNSWYWDDTLDKIFVDSKQAVIRQIEDGVRAFETSRPTCLATDWSKNGIGCFLLQQHCDCSLEKAPNCCKSGWRLVSAWSRFTNPAESRYAPVEGEALAIAESLDKMRMFVLGCPKLIIATDHKPLVKILGDRSLEDIRNPRLFSLKEKTLMYSYKIQHVPGGWHSGPDALSRFPTLPASESTQSSAVNSEYDPYELERNVEATVVAALHGDGTTDGVRAVTWERIKDACSRDRVSRELGRVVSAGFPDQQKDLQPLLQPYWNLKDQLTTVDGVPIVGVRTIIPVSLREEVLDNLHSAHQGVNGMKARARTSVYWPGIRAAIDRRRAQCRTCNRIAPSQRAEPLTPPPTPEYPFQLCVADYFTLAGHQYLAYADRYTGWVSIIQTSGDTGGRALKQNLRELFATFGVPAELSTDGGPPFPSFEVQDFLRTWGVRFRLSSAYYAQSNGRAELAVKTAKRIITDNTGSRGQLNTDKVLAALLQHRNTPVQDIGLSPAQMLYGRNLKDSLPLREQGLKIRPEWNLMAEDRERALAHRHLRARESYRCRVTELPKLHPLDKVQVQNQTGSQPKRWDKTGTIVESLGNRQYTIKMDGSGRLTLRNRRFVRKIAPIQADVPMPVIDVSCDHGDISTSELQTPSKQDEPAEQNDLHLVSMAPERTDSVEPVVEPVEVTLLRSDPLNIPAMPTLRRSNRDRRPPRELSPSLRGGQYHGFVRK